MQANVRRSMADALPPLFCDPCRKVHVLRPENRIAWDVFETCRSQQIRSEGVLIGLDHRAIREEIADRNGREDARVTYRKALAAEREMVMWAGEERERIEKERESKRKSEEAAAKARSRAR